MALDCQSFLLFQSYFSLIAACLGEGSVMRLVGPGAIRLVCAGCLLAANGFGAASSMADTQNNYRKVESLVISDDFEQDQRWLQSSNPPTILSYDRGGYVMENASSDLAVLQGFYELGVIHSESRIEITAMLLEGPQDQNFGLMFGGADNFRRAYTFGIRGDGIYTIDYWEENERKKLIQWRKNPVIKTGLGAENRLRVNTNGREIEYYINDELIDRHTADEEVDGFIGIFLNWPGMKAVFDDLYVMEYSTAVGYRGEAFKHLDLGTPGPGSIQTGRYHALIIGVEDYMHDALDLDHPLNDARRFKQVLESRYTFSPHDIKLLENPVRDQILDALDDLGDRLSDQDNLLIYYAGHGHWDEDREQGYWLPSDANKNRRKRWIANGTIRDAINGIKTRNTLLISDACFSGGIFKIRSTPSAPDPASAEQYATVSRKAITSGTQSVVPDRSVFLKYLIKQLQENQDPYMPSLELFTRFNQAVTNNSPTRQVPQWGTVLEAGDEGGDFIFVRR